MKAEETFEITGEKPAQSTKEFNCYISFPSFFESISDTSMKLPVVLVIDEKTVLKTNINSIGELLRMGL
jgi:hypothetical protein